MAESQAAGNPAQQQPTSASTSAPGLDAETTSAPPAGAALEPSQAQVPAQASTVTATSDRAPESSQAQASTSAAPSASQDATAAATDDLDASIDQDIDMTGMNDSAAVGENGNTGGPHGQAAVPDVDPVAPAPAPGPAKKDSSLREFLGKMDEYAPIIPDAVTAHYLTLAGLPPPGNGPNNTPPHLARLLALATQKFIADIATDAYQYSRIRSSNSSSANNPMGSLNAAAGLPGAGAAGAGGAAGSGAGADQGGKGKSGAGGAHLGVQRAGFGGGGQGGSGQGRTVLTMEDLGMAVAEYGVSVKRGEFYR